MIVPTHPLELLVRVAAPIAWRTDAQVAHRLRSFAATEAGSALDMLKAAELTEDPKHRRLFFRHAADEARHAQLFRAAAARVDPTSARGDRGYDLIHATRQNLYARLGPVRFLAFVYLAESQAVRQFRGLRRHFRDRPEVAALFDRVLRDERFHVGYSAHLLDGLRAAGRGAEVRVALARVRLTRAWEAWRRAGRVLGDAVSHLALLAVYALVVPLFALAHRALERHPRGWQTPRARPATLADARRQS